MDIIAITISVNYSDILEHMLEQNSKFLHKWFIVTTTADTKTIALLEKYKDTDKIHILLYDNFITNECKFNKGGAVKFAQDYIDTLYKDANILMLDSDIYLPDNFLDCLPSMLEPDTLYGAYERLDYWSLYEFRTNMNPHSYLFGSNFVGFFQLFKQHTKYNYEDSQNCTTCDNTFRELFEQKVHLNLSVKHLGKDSVNWDGRIQLEACENITHFLKSRGIFDCIIEGYSQQVPEQVKHLIELSKLPNINILEIGFNAGHSAELFLQNNPTLTVTSFDLGYYGCVLPAKEYIDSTYPNRHTLILGDSTVTIPKYRNDNPGKVFDVIFIDGGHEYSVANSDLENCRNLANKDAIVMMNDTIYTDGWERHYTLGPTRAWVDHLTKGKLIGIYRQDYEAGRGMSWGKYVV